MTSTNAKSQHMLHKSDLEKPKSSSARVNLKISKDDIGPSVHRPFITLIKAEDEGALMNSSNGNANDSNQTVAGDDQMDISESNLKNLQSKSNGLPPITHDSEDPVLPRPFITKLPKIKKEELNQDIPNNDEALDISQSQFDLLSQELKTTTCDNFTMDKNQKTLNDNYDFSKDAIKSANLQTEINVMPSIGKKRRVYTEENQLVFQPIPNNNGDLSDISKPLLDDSNVNNDNFKRTKQKAQNFPKPIQSKEKPTLELSDQVLIKCPKIKSEKEVILPTNSHREDLPVCSKSLEVLESQMRLTKIDKIKTENDPMMGHPLQNSNEAISVTKSTSNKFKNLKSDKKSKNIHNKLRSGSASKKCDEKQNVENILKLKTEITPANEELKKNISRNPLQKDENTSTRKSHRIKFESWKIKEMRSMTIGHKRKLDSSADVRNKTKLVRTVTNGQHEKHASPATIQNDVRIVDLDINNQSKQTNDKLILTQSIQEDKIGCSVSSDAIQNNIQIVELDINNKSKQANDKLFHIQSIQGDKIGSIRKSQRIKFESWKLKEMYSTTVERKRKLASSQITNKAELFHSTISNHNKEYSERMNSMHIRDFDIDVKPKRIESKPIFSKTHHHSHHKKIPIVRLPKIVGTSIKQRDNNVLTEFKMVAKDHLKNPKIDETKRELQHNQKNTARSNVDMESTSKVAVRSFPRIKIETTSANRIKENIPKLKTEIPDNDISPIRKSHRIKTETWKLKEINSMKQTFGRKNKVQQINEERTTKEPSEENDPFETDDDLNDLDFEIDSPPKRTKLNFKKMKSKTNGRHRKQNHELEINTSNPLNSTALMRPIKSTREEELDNIIAQWKPELDCMVCEKPFATYTLLHEHFKDRHQHRHEFYVQCCGLKIKKRGHLAEHIRIHTDKKAFKCAHCKIRCHRKRNLVYHMRKIHNISAKEIVPERGLNPESSQIKLSTQIIRNNDRFIEQFLPNLECPRCRQIFPVFSKLERHYRKRHKDEEFHILCCGYRLTTQSLLVDHLNRHTHPRKHKCKFCNACFTMQHVMEYHMRVDHKKNSKDSSNDNTADNVEDAHAEVLTIKESDDFISRWLPSLECHVCKEEFKSYSSLSEHFDMHHVEQQSYVTCCDHRFFTRSKLQRHIDGHINSKAFKCQLCGKRYTRNERLEFHMAKQHYGTISSVTSYCEDQPSPGTETQKILTKRKSLKDLDRTIAQWKPKLECRVCHKTYTTFTLLSRHYRDTHPAEQCYISCCGCKFAGRYDIVEHIKYHRDPNAFKCTQCGRCFNRNRGLILHMRTHRN